PARPPRLPSSPTRRSSDLGLATDRCGLCPAVGSGVSHRSRSIGHDFALSLGTALTAPASAPPATAATPLLRRARPALVDGTVCRSEEHTSELQSRENLVCR